MLKKPVIIALIFMCLCMLSHAQTHTIDSLKKNVLSAQSNIARAGALLDLCSQKYSLPSDSLYKYAAEVKKLNTVKNSHNNILADYYLTYSLLINAMEDSSLKITNSYLETLRNNVNEHEAYMLFLQLKGLIYYRINKPKETLNAFYALLSEAQQFNDTLYMLLAERGISLSYVVSGQDLEALKIFHNATYLVKDLTTVKYREAYGFLLVNASISNLHLHQRTTSALYADSCFFYANGAINMGIKSDNLFIHCQGLIARGLILSYQKKFTEAEQTLQEGLEIRKLIGDTLYIISDMSVLASFYANTKQLQKGVAICNTGIALARKRKASSALLLLLYSALAENYKNTGNYKEYADALKEQMNVKDSLSKKNSTDELNNLQSKYDLQKQENTIIHQRLDITKKNYWIFGSVILILFASTIAFLLFKNYKRKQRMKLDLMRVEDKRMAMLAVTTAEEKERKRIAADLHDNMGAYATAIIANVDEMMNTEKIDKSSLNYLKSNAAEIMTNLRDTIWALHKEKITITGISDRFKAYLQKITPAFPNIKVEIEENILNDISFSSVQALNIFRILQEAFTNALKHSNGSRVLISITSTQEFKIIIQDNGIGINEAANLKNGNGILNMKSRAAESGFKLYTNNEFANGTQIILSE